MAYGLSVQENVDSMTIKTKMVNNINRLPQQRAEYLVSNMAMLIDKSLNQGEVIDDKNTQKEFISFLISLYF